MDKLYIVKIGGNVIDNEENLRSFLAAFASIKEKKILVHGGGKLATEMAGKLNVPQQMVDGRRITDKETLKIVTMVYAGYVNKNIVAVLQANGCNAAGLSGADGNLIRAHKRISTIASAVDFGFAGDIDEVNTTWLENLLNENFTLVISPITHDKKGQLLNTNADTIASEIATSMAGRFEIVLVFCFEKPGVLQNAHDETSLIPALNKNSYKKLKEEKAVFAGMIPKLDNAFAALDKKVSRVVIGKAEDIKKLVTGLAGTSITNE
jgi:acetylglutamate kinase